ncbi:hypothetical protein HPB52_013604 [Rhipicephalus sanguineus]|uniref:Uncharacterized protein n=1 Tax=Rhipicephalus sanguineus TaxID=34632 RepID=A0A9D4Q6P1_RHISA|nr:hypothetical protein HPB52_013604 [Rhipicephalus sanguineus]
MTIAIANHSLCLSYIAAALQVARVAIAAIATDRKCFVGGVHFPRASPASYGGFHPHTTREGAREARTSSYMHDIGSRMAPGASERAPSQGRYQSPRTLVYRARFAALASSAHVRPPERVQATYSARSGSVRVVRALSGDEDRPDEAAATRAYFAAEVAAVFGLIRRFCGDMEGTGLSHLDSLDKIEASVFNFILKTKKQAQDKRFFSRK